MKTRSLCTMTLVALLGASLVGGAQAFAAELPTELPSEGKVIVEEGGESGAGKTPDPENPTEKLPEIPGVIKPNPTGGSLMIDQVSNLNFGTIKTSSKEIKQYANPITLPGGAGTRGAIVGWSDIRGGVYGYTIKAELTQQFTATKDSKLKLDNSTIEYSNSMAVADSQNTNTGPSVVTPTFKLTQSSGSLPVVTADKTKKEGKGTFVVEFGQSEKYKPKEGMPAGNIGEDKKGTDSKSVELTVPAATASNMTLDTYTAVVTWKIEAAE